MKCSVTEEKASDQPDCSYSLGRTFYSSCCLEWLQHHFTDPAVIKTDQQTREKKRRSGDKVIVTQHHVTVTTIKGDGCRISFEQEDEDNVATAVYVQQTQITANGIQQLLQSISPDCSRDDWLRVGSFLKHQTVCNGFDLWKQWSERSNNPSSKLDYEWSKQAGRRP
jgi:hypothetical protein